MVSAQMAARSQRGAHEGVSPSLQSNVQCPTIQPQTKSDEEKKGMGRGKRSKTNEFFWCGVQRRGLLLIFYHHTHSDAKGLKTIKTLSASRF